MAPLGMMAETKLFFLKKNNFYFYFSLAIAISVLTKRFEKTTAPIVPETLQKPLLIAKYVLCIIFFKITIPNIIANRIVNRILTKYFHIILEWRRWFANLYSRCTRSCFWLSKMYLWHFERYWRRRWGLWYPSSKI